MKQQISLREANQHLSRYIEAVERGDEIVITKRGRPVARLVRVTEQRKLAPEQEAALAHLLSLELDLKGYKFDREELYADRMEKIARHL